MFKISGSKKTVTGLCICFLLVLITGASVRLTDDRLTTYGKFKLFTDILDSIRQYYVDEKDPAELIDNAIKGMVSELDPHTTYLTSDHFDQWNQRYEGYSGIGVTFDIVKDKITIMSVMNGGPSDRVGLLAGDRIVGIEGKNAVGMKRDEVPLILMGPKGSMVTVTIERRGWPEPREVTIVRDDVHVASIPYSFMIQPGVGYIGIVRFSATTSDELDRSLEALRLQGMKQLIVDLRNNGGGYLEAAVEVADRFLPKGKSIVYTKGRIRDFYKEYFASDRTGKSMIPIVVLINRVTASASEIVAGSLQDWDRALILGETSFGKGLVQSQYRFRDGSALLMTTARYYTPSGRLIQRPYDDKSFDEYYNEISDEDQRTAWKTDDTRPVYRTKILRRQVTGGGGIRPDIFLSTRFDTLSPLIRRIIFSPDRPFFTYVEELVQQYPELKSNLNTFIRSYKVEGIVLQKFVEYIKKLGFHLTKTEFLENKRDLQFLIKQTIASEIWGDEARYKVQILRDYQLLEALDYLIPAEELLARAYHLRERG